MTARSVGRHRSPNRVIDHHPAGRHIAVIGVHSRAGPGSTADHATDTARGPGNRCACCAAGRAVLRRRAPRPGRVRGVPAPGRARDSPTLIGRSSRRARPARRRRRAGVLRASTARTYVVLAAARVGGILANSHPPGRVPLRQPAHPGQRARRGPGGRRRAAAVPGLVVHLPEVRPAADHRGRAAHRPAGAHQRRLRIAKIAGVLQVQALRRQYGVRFISAMPTNLYGPGDNFHADRQPRAAGDDPALPRGRAGRRGVGDLLGHRHAAAGVPARRRPGRGLPGPAGALRRPGADQRRRRRRTSPSRELAETVADVVGYRGAIEWDTSPPRRHPAQAARRHPDHRAGLAGPRSGSPKGSSRPTGGSPSRARSGFDARDRG